jgi:hypothetical protein
MNLVKVFKLYGDYIFDFKKKIEYKVIKYKEPSPLQKDLVVFHEYEEFSGIRIKQVNFFKYYCGHYFAFEAIKLFNGYKVLTLASSSHTEKLKQYYDLFDMVIVTNNIARDIGGYFSAFKELGEKKLKFENVTIFNSSQYLEKEELVQFFDCTLDPGSFVGIAYAYGPRFHILKYFHLQSYLLKYKYEDLIEILESGFALDSFYSSKYSLISRAEVRLSKLSLNKGLRPFLFGNNLVCSVDFPKLRLLFKDGRLDPNFAWKDKFTHL